MKIEPVFGNNWQHNAGPKLLSPPTPIPIKESLVVDNLMKSQDGKSKSGRAPSILWTIAEDIALVWAYIHSGGNTEKRNEQKKGDLWINILRLFEEARKEDPNINERNEQACKCRWKRMKRDVNKWVRVFHEATRQRRSEASEDDVLNDARRVFADFNNGRKFMFEHAWAIMKMYPKWQGENEMIVERSPNPVESIVSSKRSNPDTPTSGDIEGEVLCRPRGDVEGEVLCLPQGVKRIRRKGKAELPAESIETLTRAIENMSRMRESELKFDVERFELMKQMFEHTKETDAERERARKERDAEKKRATEKKMRFKIYITLLAKSSLTPEQMQTFAKLDEEFKVI